MNNKLFIAFVIACAALLQTPAHSAVQVTSIAGASGNVQNAVAGSTYITFEDVVIGTYGNFTSGGFNFTGSSSGASVVRTGSGDGFDVPSFDGSRYVGIHNNDDGPLRSQTLTLSTDYTKFGLYWGSMSTSDTIVFSNNGVTVFTLTGNAVPGANVGSSSNSATRNRYVNIDFTPDGLAFDKVVFRAGSDNDFEFDNLALAGHAPELSTWAMMLIGFGGLGVVAYRRSRKISAVALG